MRAYPFGCALSLQGRQGKSSAILDYKHWVWSWSLINRSACRWLSHKPESRLPLFSTRPAVTFQPNSVTAVWRVSNYTAGWQRDMDVNKLQGRQHHRGRIPGNIWSARDRISYSPLKVCHCRCHHCKTKPHQTDECRHCPPSHALAWHTTDRHAERLAGCSLQRASTLQ